MNLKSQQFKYLQDRMYARKEREIIGTLLLVVGVVILYLIYAGFIRPDLI